MLLRSVTPEEMLPFFGMVTGIVFMVSVVFTVVRVAQGQIGQAIARRLHGKSGGDSDLQSELLELRGQVADLAQRLSDSEERLDFTERLLARGKEDANPHG